jgi:S-adenosylmethionine:tRNA ribosyltransferase-isomerase
MTDPQQPTELALEDFDYELPTELIAQHPSAARTDGRLLRLAGEAISDHAITELPQFVAAGDTLVFNDTKVIKARLSGVRATGGRVEVLVERVLGAHEALAQIRASNAPAAGARLRIADAFDVEVISRDDDLFRLRVLDARPVLSLLAQFGSLPLPPYIGHAPDAADEVRYQTVYARTPGAVAAPTAGLHFDSEMLDRLQEGGVRTAFLTLHVGAGTFQPVRAARIAEHRMHSEWYDIPQATIDAVAAARAGGHRVVAVGTTSLRAMESAARHGALAPGAAETDLFITPGFRFRVVDRLFTNFHLPRSTLLMLVSAFAGIAPIRRAYRHAIAERYRFFSYGDAMLVDRNDGSE